MDSNNLYYVKRVNFANELRYSLIEKDKIDNLRISSFFRDYSKSNVSSKRIRDLKRSKRNFIEKALHNFSSEVSLSFLTLTYSQNMQDLELAKKDLSNFFRSLKNSFKKDIKYSYVYEFQSRGAIHFHVLINVSKNNLLKKAVKYWKKYNPYCQGVDIQNVKSPSRKIKYMTKYMVKEYEALVDISKFHNINSNVKLYQFSANCDNPIVDVFLVNFEPLKFHEVFNAMEWGYIYSCSFHSDICSFDFSSSDCIHREIDFCIEGCLGFHGFSSRSNLAKDPFINVEKFVYVPFCSDMVDGDIFEFK